VSERDRVRKRKSGLRVREVSEAKKVSQTPKTTNLTEFLNLAFSVGAT